MIITRANLDALRVTLVQTFGAAYAAATPELEKIATTVPSSTKSNTYGWLAQQVTLREWIGQRVTQNLSEHDYTLPNKSFEGTVELDRDDVADDNLGHFEVIAIQQLAEATKKHPDRQIAALLAANPLAFDGLSLFHNSHPTFAPAGSTQTYDNEFASTALTALNLEAVMAVMASYVGEDGQPLEVRPTHILVPPQLEITAKQIVSSATYSARVSGEGADNIAVDNPLRGVVDVIVSKRLAGAPTVWYPMDLSKAIKPVIRQLRQAPNFVSRDNPQDPKVFDLKKFTYGVDLRDAYGVSLPFLIARCTA